MEDELFICDKCLKKYKITNIKIFNYDHTEDCSEYIPLTIICKSCYNK